MGNRKISPDLKLAAVRLHERGVLTTREILECVGFSRRTFLRICKLYRETGDVIKPRSEYIGRPRALNIEDVAYLTELVQHRPDWFLDELAGLVQRNRFISLHYTTIHRELHRAGISLKKLRKVAKERNEDVRADFMRRMAHYTSDELCFIDETSKDDRTPFRRHGRAKKSRRASMRGVFVRGRRVTAVAALTVDGIIAGHIVEGSLRRKGYLNFLEHSVVSTLNCAGSPYFNCHLCYAASTL
jgi:transposase